MRHFTATLFLITTILSFSPVPPIRSQEPLKSIVNTESVPQAGECAPDFELPSQSGTVTGLSSSKGKWVVLYFYPEDMIAGCTIEAHNFQRDAAKFAAKNAVIVGVSVDSVDNISTSARKRARISSC